MSRGKKLDIFIGANIGNEWAEVKEKNTSTCKDILIPSQHILHFKKEKRRGKVVTLVGKFSLHVNEAKKVLKELKRSFGCGGSYKEPYMEFQGEMQNKLKEALEKKDFRFK